MSANKTPIFLLGGTGYIGGAILQRLIQHPSASTFDITLLVRNPAKAKIIESAFGHVTAVVGDHSELEKIEGLVEKAHVVINAADADDLPLTKAILTGLRKRHATLGDLPILIHTSGTGLLTDDARGQFATELIYDDSNAEQIESISPNALHRNVDLLIVEADKQGFARTYIVLPSTIYGIAKGPIFDSGFSNPHSQQIPNLIKAAFKRKRAGVLGPGKAIWPDVHIDDVADLYIILFDAITNNPEKVGHGREGFYFGENGEHTWLQISEKIGEALHAHGIAESPEPTPFAGDELVPLFGSEGVGNFFGSNSRCRANHSRSLGWKPKYTTKDMLASIKPEVEALWRQQLAKA